MNAFTSRLKTKNQKLLFAQSLTLLIGSFIGWREVISEINYFCEANNVGLGGLTSFSGNLTTNPILTPCFWGSIAFVVALIWSIYIFWLSDKTKKLKNQAKLFILLIGSVIFAWANTAYTFYKFYGNSTGTDHFGCPADRIDDPWTTACFMGATAFLIAFWFALVYRRTSKSKD